MDRTEGKLQEKLREKNQITYPVYIGLGHGDIGHQVGRVVASSALEAYQRLVKILRDLADELEQSHIDPHRTEAAREPSFREVMEEAVRFPGPTPGPE